MVAGLRTIDRFAAAILRRTARFREQLGVTSLQSETRWRAATDSDDHYVYAISL
jgi:hypothetical protein